MNYFALGFVSCLLALGLIGWCEARKQGPTQIVPPCKDYFFPDYVEHWEMNCSPPRTLAISDGKVACVCVK